MGERDTLWERIDPMVIEGSPAVHTGQVHHHTDTPSTLEERLAGAFCPLCRSDYRWSRKPIVCENCNVLLSWVWKSEEEYENWYKDPEAYHVDEQVSQGQRACTDTQRRSEAYQAARKRLQSLLFYYEPKARLLDIGCGTGEFVHTARNYGYEAYGIDPNPALSTSGKMITAGTWKDVQGVWDIFTLHDVFEHLTRPRECLRHLKDHLSEKGLIVVEQPEFDSSHQRAAGMAWKHIRPRQHVCLWSRLAFEQVVAEEGFGVIGFHRPLRGSLGKMCHYLQKVQVITPDP